MSAISIDEASRLARQAVDLYAAAPVREHSFGAWVLRTVYPEVDADVLVRGRDFYYAVRTEDARLYLVGFLARGTLPAQPLQQALLALH